MEQTISFNPATKEEIARYHKNSYKEVLDAIIRAKASSKLWQQIPINKRKKSISKIRKYLVNNYLEVAETISADNGKVLTDAYVAEVLPAIMAVGFYTKYCKKWLKPHIIPGNSMLTFNKCSKVHYQPYGVIGIISPWNYPFSIPFSEVVMALLAGNGVILKCSRDTLVVGHLLEKVIQQADLPDGLFSLINIGGSEAVDAFIEGGIDKIFFTGSVPTGIEIQKKCSDRLIPTVLELGGNDPAIVCNDADLEKAAWGIIWAGFQNSGQSCGGAQRIIVDQQVYDKFCSILNEKVSGLRPGKNVTDDSFEDGEIGFMTNSKQKETVINQVIKSLELGAILNSISPLPEELRVKLFKDQKEEEYMEKVTSSKEDSINFLQSLLKEETNFLPAMVLTEINQQMPIFCEEVFGPAIGIISFDYIEQAIDMANDSRFGLTGSVWSQNIKLANQIAKKLECGVIMINDHLMSHGLANTPWGGYKYSGIGRTHGKAGFMEMTRQKVIIKDKLTFAKKQLWWHPYNQKVWGGLVGAMEFLYSKNIKDKFSGFCKLFKIISRFFEK